MGAALGLSRAAIHKQVQALVNRGVPIHRVPGRGYRLAEGVTLLDGRVIGNRMSARARALATGIEILEEVDSTSAYLAAGAAAHSVDGRICLAETQTAGRGRRGRCWAASPYRDLVMSIGVEYPQWPPQLPTLGLAAALLIIGALESLGVKGLMLKWPNDVIHGQRKLCGILLDVTGEAHGMCRVIVGIGVNVSMSSEPGRTMDRQWIDLETITGQAPDRNTVAAECLNVLLPAFQSFPVEGFAGYWREWRRLDALRGQAITVHGADGGIQHGKADGVDESGRLRVTDESGKTRVFTQGDVSVRPR